MTHHKQLWVLTGGNGAGKSTFYRLFLKPAGLKFVNADVIAAQYKGQQSADFSYIASRIAGQLRHDLLKEGVSFCFETVFSHPSKIDFIAEAKALGYEVILVFIHLQTDELNQARVAQRVTEGGHDVPANKIISRIPRTLQHIRTALPLLDQAQFYDNSSQSKPFLAVAHLEKNQITHSMNPLPEWAKQVLRDHI